MELEDISQCWTLSAGVGCVSAGSYLASCISLASSRTEWAERASRN